MKDIPHHMQKINRQVIRSEHREALFEEETPPRKQTAHQIKKQAKAKLTKTRNSRIPIHMTEEERNKKMLKRVPVFDRLKHPKIAKPSRKKTPRI